MTTKCVKKKNYLHIKLIIIMVLITIITFICYKKQNDETSYATSVDLEEAMLKEYKKIEQNINLNEIIEQNINNREEKIEITEEDLEYTTTYQTSDELSKDTLQVLQEGKTGKQQKITKKILVNGELVSEEPMGAKVIVSSIDKIVLVGTANYKNNYKVKKGDILYVTSNTLDVRQDKSEESRKSNHFKQK